jgi:hypothetical protein
VFDGTAPGIQVPGAVLCARLPRLRRVSATDTGTISDDAAPAFGGEPKT